MDDRIVGQLVPGAQPDVLAGNVIPAGLGVDIALDMGNSMGRSSAKKDRTAGSVFSRSDSSSDRTSSGKGTGGIGSWCSMPSAGSMNEQPIDRMVRPYCTACTRRVEKDRPSRTFSTRNLIGWLSSPPRTK